MQCSTTSNLLYTFLDLLFYILLCLKKTDQTLNIYFHYILQNNLFSALLFTYWDCTYMSTVTLHLLKYQECISVCLIYSLLGIPIHSCNNLFRNHVAAVQSIQWSVSVILIVPWLSVPDWFKLVLITTVLNCGEKKTSQNAQLEPDELQTAWDDHFRFHFCSGHGLNKTV